MFTRWCEFKMLQPDNFVLIFRFCFYCLKFICIECGAASFFQHCLQFLYGCQPTGYVFASQHPLERWISLFIFRLSKISHQSFCLSFSIYFNVNTTFTRQIHQLIPIKNNSDKHNTVLLLFYECSDIHNSHNNTEHQILLKIKWKHVSRHRCSSNNNN